MTSGRFLKVHPEWVPVRAFALTIIVGTVLLMLPFSSQTGSWTPFLSALFTSTSATCVTGLTVLDTAQYYSLFGQTIILTLIQIGGLGVMTLSAMLLVMVGHRLSMISETVLMDALGQDPAVNARVLVKRIIIITLIYESLGTLVLFLRFFIHYDMGLHHALYMALFHSISAFCNAGFALFSDSLYGFRNDPVILLTICTLVIVGGLGFLVVCNIGSIKPWRKNLIRRGRLSLHSRCVLISTAILLAGGFFILLGSEWNGALETLSWPSKLLNAFFSTVTPRTAGFNTVSYTHFTPAGTYFTSMLMFIGGGPGSTAGGIKVTTILAMFLALRAMVQGREYSSVAGRALPINVMRESLCIFLISITIVSIAFECLLLSEKVVFHSSAHTPTEYFFETVSAFGTVGLSMNVTPDLSSWGRIIIIMLMFAGRLGPMTLALTIGKKEVKQVLKFPEEDIMVG